MGIRLSDLLRDSLTCWPAELLQADMAGNMSYFDIAVNQQRICNNDSFPYLYDRGTVAIMDVLDGFYYSLSGAYDAIMDACATVDELFATAGTRHELYEEMDMMAIWRCAVENWTGPKDYTGFTAYLREYGHGRY